MSNIGMYLARATDLCAETRNVVEDTINAVQKTNVGLLIKKEILKESLKTVGFSGEQLTAFAKGEIPPEHQIVPVEVGITRFYRTYVRVKCGSDDVEVMKEAKKQIVEEQDSCIELDPDLEIDSDDISMIQIDWEGAENE